MPKAKVLVTGGAGYLGSILVPALLEADFQVTVLDNFVYRQNSLAHICHFPNFKVFSGDVRVEGDIRPLLADADIVIPLAGLVGAPLCAKDPIGATSINRDAILNILKYMDPSQWMLMPTTNSGYGVGEKDKFCTEESPLRPLSLYARDKVEVERAVLDRGNAISFRLATVFGMSPRMRIDLLVNDLTYRAVHDRCAILFEAHFRRNFIHIRDITRVFLHGIAHFEEMKNGPFNVGLSEANLTKWELCQRIKKHVPQFEFLEASVGEDPDKRDYLVSNQKIESTGFKPLYSLDDGIQELVKGYTMIRNIRFGNV